MKYWNSLLNFSPQFCFHLLFPSTSKSTFLKNAVCFLSECCLDFVLIILPVSDSTASGRFSAIEQGVKPSNSNSKSHSCSSKDHVAWKLQSFCQSRRHREPLWIFCRDPESWLLGYNDAACKWRPEPGVDHQCRHLVLCSSVSPHSRRKTLWSHKID